MDAFVDVARLSDIPLGAGLAVELSERHVALFRVDGRVLATDGDCVRCGASLASGSLDGYDVECAQCGWHYDVETGRMRTVPSLRLDTFDVRMCGTVVTLLDCSTYAPVCREAGSPIGLSERLSGKIYRLGKIGRHRSYGRARFT